MQDQLTLDGFDAAPQVHSLFFALRPDPASAMRIRDLARRIRAQQRLDGRLLAPDRLHVTLQPVGKFAAEMPHRLLEAIHAKLSSLALAPLHVTFDRVMSFSSSGAVVLSGDEVQCARIIELRDAVRSTLGFRDVAGKTAKPHMTLLYASRMLDEQPVDRITWTASEFVLIDSLQKKTQHVTLGRWPLGGNSIPPSGPATGDR